MTLALLCGFRAEERIATEVTGLTAIGWHNPDAAQALIAHGATTLISFGIAGALDPTLRTGDLLLPTNVIAGDEPFRCSEDLHELLLGAFPDARTQPIAYEPRIVATAVEKRALADFTGAIGIDMESGPAARAATEAGIPFAVVRAVSDQSGDTLPPAALAGLTIEGDVDYLGVIGSLLRHPLQLPELMRTGRQSRIAMDRLREAAPILKRLLG